MTNKGGGDYMSKFTKIVGWLVLGLLLFGGLQFMVPIGMAAFYSALMALVGIIFFTQPD